MFDTTFRDFSTVAALCARGGELVEEVNLGGREEE
jgi:hypothetical protein